MSKFKGVGVNPELPVVLLLTILLFLGGILAIFIGDKPDFNFYSSQIDVNGIQIQEELHFKPNKPYHTLYRNFENKVYSSLNNRDIDNSVVMISVECSSGEEYLRDYNGVCYNSNGFFSCPVYTENNEYGCTFGEVLGFSKGEEYTLNAEYTLNPENLFKVNNKYYIKFVAYSPGDHIKLSDNNFVVQGEVVKNEKYFPNENVVLYIPYTGDVGSFNIIELDDFEFDSDSKSFLKYLLVLFPGLIFFLLWFALGKERSYDKIPRELSDFPSKRTFWEVAAYFNPPFLKLDKNFFAANILNLYNKKIIDIKEKDEEIYIKINNFKGDELERKIYNLLGEAEELLKSEINKGFFSFKYLTSKEKENSFDGDYFNLKNALKNNALSSSFLSIRNEVKKEGKKYVENNSGITLWAIVLSSFFVSAVNSNLDYPIYSLNILYVSFFVVYILTFLLTKGTLFSRYKKDYYIEYQKWKAFKRYLKNSFSIKTATHKTVVIWNEYLVYATALGVPDKVIKELKASNLIDERQMNVYNGVILASSASFSSASGGAGGAGGFGGAGGGGVGGGGGGGR